MSDEFLDCGFKILRWILVVPAAGFFGFVAFVLAYFLYYAVPFPKSLSENDISALWRHVMLLMIMLSSNIGGLVVAPKRNAVVVAFVALFTSLWFHMDISNPSLTERGRQDANETFLEVLLISVTVIVIALGTEIARHLTRRSARTRAIKPPAPAS